MKMEIFNNVNDKFLGSADESNYWWLAERKIVGKLGNTYTVLEKPGRTKTLLDKVGQLLSRSFVRVGNHRESDGILFRISLGILWQS